MLARWSACVFLAWLYLAAVPHSKGFRYFLSLLPSWCKFHTQKEQKKRAKMPVFLNSSGILEPLTCSTDDDLERELLPSIGKRKQGWWSVWLLAFLHIYPSYFCHGSCWLKCTASWVDTSICWAVMKEKTAWTRTLQCCLWQLFHSYESVHLLCSDRDKITKPPDLWLTFCSSPLQKFRSGLVTSRKLSSELLRQGEVPRENSVEYISWLRLMLDWG